EHLALSSGELAEVWCCCRAAPDEVPDESSHRSRGDQGISCRRGPDREQDLFRRGVLQQETARARQQPAEDVLVEVESSAQDPPGRLRRQRDDSLSRLDAVTPRHPDVHHYDVGAEHGRPAGCLQPVSRLAGDLKIGLGADQLSQAGPYHRLVVGKQDPDGHQGLGRNARTTKPSWPGPASNRPPSKRARSLSPASPAPPPRPAGSGGTACPPGPAARPSSATSIRIPVPL